jgi:hypothetical protein
MNFEMVFDAGDLQRIQLLANYKQYLDPQTHDAMQDSVNMLQADSRAYMWATFKNPTGPLEDAVQVDVIDASSGMVFNESPYAWRREEGFSGMTDSLGRFFPSDSGIHYFATTLAQDADQIEQRFAQAMQAAFTDMGVVF